MTACRIGCVVLIGSFFSLCIRAEAQCPLLGTRVDTGTQNCGVAPRFDLEVGIRFGAALGNPCLEVDDTRSCRSPGFPTIGVEVVTSFRFWRRVAIGFVGAYDQRIGSTSFGPAPEQTPEAEPQPEQPEAPPRADYSNHMWRVMFELRWYSRSVAKGGLFVALRAGAMWVTDTVSPRDENVDDADETQLAPVFGIGIGGQFMPYRGLGMTLALHGFLAPLPDEGPRLPGDLGRAFAYGDTIFFGVTWGALLGVGL